MSRRSKFTDPVKKRILKAISLGSTYQIASEFAGITDVTLYSWIKQGHNQKTGKFREFLDQLRAAEAESAVCALQTINLEIKQGNLKAAFFLLERRHRYKRDFDHKRANTMIEAMPTNQPTTIKDALSVQVADLQKAMKSAAKSESWQAYAALGRQLLSVYSQMHTIEQEAGEIDQFDTLDDEQILNEITNAIIALPPLARQRILGDLSVLAPNNVIPIKK